MKTEEVLQIFRDAGAVLEGHFVLTSGLRSPIFLQKARVFMHADKTERLCRALAERIRAEVPGRIDYVVGPAVGGLIPAYETSRHLGVPAIWVEREGGSFRLRRFEIEKGARIVIVEDIVTTGLSIRETIACLRRPRRRSARRGLHHRPLRRQGRRRRAAGRARRIRGAGLSARPGAAGSRRHPAGQARQPRS